MTWNDTNMCENGSGRGYNHTTDYDLNLTYVLVQTSVMYFKWFDVKMYYKEYRNNPQK